MQHAIEEIRPGLFRLSEKKTTWRFAYFVKQAWGHCLCFNLSQIEPFVDFFKSQGGLAYHLISSEDQFSTSNARIFFKFGATTLAPEGAVSLFGNPSAKVLPYNSSEFFKANLRQVTYASDMSKTIFSLSTGGTHYVFLDGDFKFEPKKIIYTGQNLSSAKVALDSLTKKLKKIDFYVSASGTTYDSGLLPFTKHPIDIYEELPPNETR